MYKTKIDFVKGNKEYINNIFDKIKLFIERYDDEIIKRYDNDTFRWFFINYIYDIYKGKSYKNDYLLNDNELEFFDYFYTKYNTDIVDLFLLIREITNSYCLNIFGTLYQNQNGSLNLTEFLFDNIVLEYENNDDDDTELNNEENIYNIYNI